MIRWNVVELPERFWVRVFEVRKGRDVAIVELDGVTFYCQECPAPLVHERTSCRHTGAAKRFVSRMPAAVPEGNQNG